MDLTPLGVYRKGVEAVPHIRVGMGVAGVVAAGVIALSLAKDRPLLAVLSFLFVLAGMYLILIFAGISDLAGIVRGPVTVLIWAVTLLFVAFLVMVVTAFGWGYPAAAARLLGLIPSSVRVETTAQAATPALQEQGAVTPTRDATPATTAQAATPALQEEGAVTPTRDATPATTAADARPNDAPPAAHDPMDGARTSAADPGVAIQPPPAPREPVQHTVEISDSSDDCGTHQTRLRAFCLPPGATVQNWEGPNITTANCGSSVTNIRQDPNQPNCILVDVTVRGCGYDELPFGIRNCRGRGWIGATLTINGVL